jgi:tripartite-type tricarboxylate transporter receptor subunit TctC
MGMLSVRLVRSTVAVALLAIAFGSLLAASLPARAEYPDRPIKIIVPFPPGGAVDVLARLLTQRLSEDQAGWTFVIENKAGAGGIIATDATAKAVPDGYTLLLTAPNHTINAAMKAKLPYDAEKDLMPISVVGEVPELLVTHPDMPFKTFPEFIAYAKANPGKLNYSSAGVGTLPHVTMEHLMRLAGIQMAHVPYRGAAPALSDLIAGHVQMKYDTITTAGVHVSAGKLRALAYAGRKRSPLMPDVPTIDEQGFPGYVGILWVGLMAPAGTAKGVIDRIGAAVRRAVAAREFSERLQKDGFEPIGSTAESFAELVSKEIVLWRELAKSAKISLD